MNRISIAEPVTILRRIRIVECGEPLVDFMEVCPDLILDRPRFRYRRETNLRRSVAEMLCQANRNLPVGVRLAVVEGWRGPHIQKRMYMAVWNIFKARNPDWSESHLRRVANRYTAPMNRRVPPPHTTGGAVDLHLADATGKLLDHSSPYDPTDPKGFAFDAPGLSDGARMNRGVLRDALIGTGLTNYPSEYWHWSYGDQGWAYRGGHPNAIYAAIQPDDWAPEPEDVSESPLEWVIPRPSGESAKE